MPEKKQIGSASARLPETEPPPPPALETVEAAEGEPIDAAPVVIPAPAADLPPTKTPKEWAKTKGTPPWQLAGATCGEVWPADKTLTEADFDEAIKRALGAQSG